MGEETGLCAEGSHPWEKGELFAQTGLNHGRRESSLRRGFSLNHGRKKTSLRRGFSQRRIHTGRHAVAYIPSHTHRKAYRGTPPYIHTQGGI